MKRWILLGVVAVAMAGCQTLTEELPSSSSPTGSPTAPSGTPVVVVPVQIPSPTAPAPNPTPTPNTPAPNPTPTPAPQAPDLPTGQDGVFQTNACGAGPGRGPGDSCPRGNDPQFLEQVEKALNRATTDHPEIFDLKDGGPCGNCYRVKDVDRYNQIVVANLGKQGLCAISGEEFGVKIENSFNEQYDLLTSDLHIRRQGGSYRGTCRPADF